MQENNCLSHTECITFFRKQGLTLKNFLVLVEFTFLAFGIFFPLAEVDQFWILSSEFSILSLSKTLLLEKEWILGLVVFSFGVVFPILKILIRHFKITKLEKFNLHRFSMVDIFLLSFIVFIGKLSLFYEIELLIGFYFLLLSIIVGYIHIIFSRFTREIQYP